MPMNLGISFEVFWKSGAPGLNEGLFGLPLVPSAGGEKGCVPASLELGALFVCRWCHGDL
jgi:hypothetical protein